MTSSSATFQPFSQRQSPPSFSYSSFPHFEPPFPSSFQQSPFVSSYQGSLRERAVPLPSTVPIPPLSFTSSMPPLGYPSSFTPPPSSLPSHFVPRPLQGRAEPFIPANLPSALSPPWVNESSPSFSHPRTTISAGSPPALFHPLELSFPRYPDASSSQNLFRMSPPSMPHSLPGIANSISPFHNFNAALPSTNRWEPPSLPGRSPFNTPPTFPSGQEIRVSSFHWSPFSSTPEADRQVHHFARRRLEESMKEIARVHAPPEPLIPMRMPMAFQINAQTTILIDPLAFGSFLQRATAAEKRAITTQLIQLRMNREAIKQATSASSLPNKTSSSLVRYPLSDLAHTIYDLYGNEAANFARALDWVERLSSPTKIQQTSRQQQAREQKQAGHAAIDKLLNTLRAYRYDPNYQPLVPVPFVKGEIPFPCTGGTATLAGRASQIKTLEGSLAGTRAVAAKAIEGAHRLECAPKVGKSTYASFPKYSLPPLHPPVGAAYNRAAFEEYKAVLRAQMEKPYVVDSQLKDYVDVSYKPHASIGSGSTAAAIRYELATGGRVFDKLHSKKGRDMITTFERWLKNNPTARPGDRAAAENIIKDLRNALGE